MVPDIYVICLESKFAERGAATLTFLANNIDKHLYGTLKKFTAVTPSDFIIEDTASARQVAIIRGRKRRVEQGDMSKHAQVACALSHISLWQLCVQTNNPIVVVEDDVHPLNMSKRLKEALELNGDVVLISCAKLVRNDRTKTVSRFSGTGSYFITPNGASSLLKHVYPVSMHVDYYMSTCIAAYNLNVLGVDNAQGQLDMVSGKLSTLDHSSLLEVQVSRLEVVVFVLACLIAITVLVCGVHGIKMFEVWRHHQTHHSYSS